MNIVNRIDEYHEKNKKDPRPHLGASQIGKECVRQIWYDFRLASTNPFSGRMLRLFRHGYTYEPIFIEDLRKIGYTVITKNRKTGKDISFKTLDGHFAGSVDGMAHDKGSKEWLLLEFKTHSEKSFNKLKKQTVAKAKPEHYMQMQVYMHFMKVKKALYLAVNKNTDELYYEDINYDKKCAVTAIERAALIINSATPPPQISDDPESFKCRFCSHKNVCHKIDIPEFNCRTCVHSSPADKSDWACGMNEKILSFKDQLKGCKEHEFIPALIEGFKDECKHKIEKKDYFDFMVDMHKEFGAKAVEKEIRI